MLKLIKYEFRKSMGAFWALLGVAAAVEAYFLISLRAGKDDHVAVSMLLLFLCAFAGAGLIAQALSLLVRRAAALQQESELTI